MNCIRGHITAVIGVVVALREATMGVTEGRKGNIQGLSFKTVTNLLPDM